MFQHLCGFCSAVFFSNTSWYWISLASTFFFHYHRLLRHFVNSSKVVECSFSGIQFFFCLIRLSLPVVGLSMCCFPFFALCAGESSYSGVFNLHPHLFVGHVQVFVLAFLLGIALYHSLSLMFMHASIFF